MLHNRFNNLNEFKPIQKYHRHANHRDSSNEAGEIQQIALELMKSSTSVTGLLEVGSDFTLVTYNSQARTLKQITKMERNRCLTNLEI